MSSKEFFNRIEQASRDEIANLQLKRMQKSLIHAYVNVPFWKKRFTEHGVHPDDLNSLEDLAKFPFMVKDDFKDNYPFGLLAVEQKDVVRIHASSGTTGKPKIVAYTQNDIDMWADAVARSMYAAGVRPEHTVQIAYGYGMFALLCASMEGALYNISVNTRLMEDKRAGEALDKKAARLLRDGKAYMELIREKVERELR